MSYRPLPSSPPLTAAILLLTCALLSVPGPAGAQETAPEVDRTFTGETTVTVVEVPVRVLANGEPVTGLEAEDFRVFDAGDERRILSVERVDLREGLSEVVGFTPDHGQALRALDELAAFLGAEDGA